jgi:lipopolysaccharide biosynthesis glycosyltransferase
MMAAMPDGDVTVFLAADEGFSRPLAVTVRSLVAHLTPGRSLALHLCDMGLSPRSRALIERVAQHPDVRVRWIDDLLQKVAHLPQSWTHISAATYARLFIPALLPGSVGKALYLDCDLIVRRCVGELFDTAIDRYAAMAVANAGAPYVSSPLGLPYWSRSGRRADEVNFNAGVLLMNVAAWRDDDVTGAALNYLAKDHVFQGDQAAINAVLPGRIGELDPRWNQQTGHFTRALQAALPYSDEQFEWLLSDPWIVHFTTDVKPWHFRSTHPFRREWFARLDETPYRGWRPSRSAYYAGMSARALREAKRVLLPRVTSPGSA